MDPRITEERIREILERNWAILTPKEAIEYETRRLAHQDEIRAILDSEGIPEDNRGNPSRPTRYAMRTFEEIMIEVEGRFSFGPDHRAGICASMVNPELSREIRLTIPPTPDFRIGKYLYWEDFHESSHQLIFQPSVLEINAWVAWVKGGESPNGHEEN